ncbi:MAG: HNH endonuclease signature motif containing protein, partial [Acidimicrobiaceae bacterium]|nr:HNH endonuclease signature motif containing protein [Acidimicrobiaceae bacterium]
PDTTTDGTGGRPDTTTDGTGGRPDTTTDGSDDGTGGRPDTTGDTASRIEGRSFADICVMVRTDDDTGRLIAELPDRTRLPRPVLDALSCDATISGVICDRQGSPIWRSYASRGATDAQKQILFATYGGCFNCGANPGLCQIHHIEPVWLGGRTEINNLVPLCYRCHDRIHHHGWWILKRTLGHHTMHPPDHARHGPAHESDHPVLYRIAPPANHSPDDPRPADAAAGPNRHRRGPPHTVDPPIDSDLPLGDRRREPALF